MALGALVRRRPPAPVARRSTDIELSWNDYVRQVLAQTFTFGGHTYGSTMSKVAYGADAFDNNGPVFSLIAVRALVFSEARFAFQRFANSRPADLYGTAALRVLEQPWPGATTRDLLVQMELDASLYGNSYWILRGGELVRLDPTQVTVVYEKVLGDYQPLGQRLLGYSVQSDRTKPAEYLLPEEVAHYRPLPSRQAFVGASWLSAVLPDVNVDGQMTTYKQAFLANGATPGLVVSFDSSVSKEAFDAFVAAMDASHEGVAKAGETLYLGGGADVKVVGSTFEQLALKATQGAGETRLASAAGVPASIVGFSEGMQGSSLNAGNYGATRRRFADGTMRSLWAAASGALATLVPPPDSGSRLWTDLRDVSFLQEDKADEAKINQIEAQTIRTLIEAGYIPDMVVQAVVTGDYGRLVGAHTGLTSVQLQAPAPDAPDATDAEDAADSPDAEDATDPEDQQPSSDSQPGRAT